MEDVTITATQARVVEIRDSETGRLLFKVFPDSWQLEIQQRKRRFIVDLRALFLGTEPVDVQTPDIIMLRERVSQAFHLTVA